jgi:hypothetical protein
VGRLSFLTRLFGGSASPNTDKGIYVRVKCAACGEIVQTRINPATELSQSDEGEGYFVRKVLVGRQCYRPIEIKLRYADLKGKELSREVSGGTSAE